MATVPIESFFGSNTAKEIEDIKNKWIELSKVIDDFNAKGAATKLSMPTANSVDEIRKLQTAVVEYQQSGQQTLTLQRTLNETIRAGAAVVAEYNGKSREILAVSKTLAETSTEEARARRENAKAMIEEQRYIAALTKEKEKQEAQERKSKKALDESTNAYVAAKKVYNEKSTALKGMIVEYGLADEKVIALKADVDKLYASLLKAEKAVGQHGREVGKYQNATLALSQLIREAPAFANSMQTGLMGISNNIFPLIDQFKILRAELGSNMAALRVLGVSFFSFTNILSLVYTGILLFTSGVLKFGSAADEMAEKLKKIDQQAREHVKTEAASANALLSIAQDVTQSMELRIRAVEDLQKKYPDYLGNLSQEAILTGKTAEAMERLNNALINKALYTASLEKIGEYAKEYVKLQDKLKDQQDELAQATKNFNDLNNGSTNQYAVNAKTRAATDKAAAERNIEGIKQQIAETEKAMQKYQALANGFAAKAAPLILSPLDKQSKGKEAATPERGGRQAYIQAVYELEKQQLSIEAATQKEISEDVAKQLDVRLEANKLYHEKLLELARLEYQKELELADANIQDHINKQKQLQQKLSEVRTSDQYKGEEKEKEIATLKKNIENEQFYIDAGREKKKAVEEKAQSESITILAAGKKQQLAILRSSGEQFIDEYKDKLEAQKIVETEAYLQELGRLREALESKKITRSKYDDEVKRIQDAHNIAMLEAEVDFNKALLENDDLTTKQRLEVAKRLVAAEEALFNARVKDSKDDNAKQKTHHITDFIADAIFKAGDPNKRLGKEDVLEFERQFYEKSVQLAREASNAIISIKEGQFKKEQDYLNEQEQAIRNSYNDRVIAIQAEAGYQEEKNQKVKDLEASTAANTQRIEQQKKELEQKRAKFEREAAIAQIIAQGAVGVANIWARWASNPVIALSLIALESGAIAAALASAQSAPIPQYAEGTESHPGGLAVVGEGGQKEWIQPPNAPGYWSGSKAGLYNLPKGTSVTPLSKIDESLRTGVFNNTISKLAPTISGMEIAAAYANANKLQGREMIDKIDDLIDVTAKSRPLINIRTTDAGLSARANRAFN